RIIYERRLPNDPLQIRAALAPHREELVGVVIEATFNWYWLVDQLINDGYRVHLANPAAIRQYEGLKYSGDFTDAAHLAQLLRLGLLPEGYIYPAEERPVRDLSRKRIQLVQCRTAQILAIENLFSRHTGGQMQAERVKHLDVTQVNGFGFAPDVTHRDASQSGSHANLAGGDRHHREATHGKGETAPGLRVAELGARHWSGSRNHDHAGNRHHLTFHQGW
ncbi:transposase, partial [Paraburkholderia azotifigens]